jgi:hypothetical protein
MNNWDVYRDAPTLKAHLNMSIPWNYIFKNVRGWP